MNKLIAFLIVFAAGVCVGVGGTFLFFILKARSMVKRMLNDLSKLQPEKEVK